MSSFSVRLNVSGMQVLCLVRVDDAEIRAKTTVPHRRFFKEQAIFHDVAEIKDPYVLREIHLNFRLSYLRDCALAHYLDEKSLIMITSIIQENYMEIIKHIQTNKEVVRNIFDSLRQNKMNGLKMIHEICSVIKPLMVQFPTLPTPSDATSSRERKSSKSSMNTTSLRSSITSSVNLQTQRRLSKMPRRRRGRRRILLLIMTQLVAYQCG